MSPVPCSLLLEVFEPPALDYDGSTNSIVAWEVSTDPAHAFPYLLAPRQYAEQEIDPIACTASIGQVEVGVIDVPEDLGDQDTGWMTARIHDMLGRRCRLTRYIDATIGWVVIADGPAGSPSMDSSYAAYRWTIRDTRETERKLSAFQFGGSSGIVPRGPMYGFGYHTDLSGDHVLLSPLLDDPDPVWGSMQVTYVGGRWVGTVDFSSHYIAVIDPDAPTAEEIRVWGVSLHLIDVWADGWRSSGQDPYDMSSSDGNRGLDAMIAASTITLAQFNNAATNLGVSFGPGTAWILNYRNALVTAIAQPSVEPPKPLIDDVRLDLDDDAIEAIQTTEASYNVFSARTADVLWRIRGDAEWNLSRPTSPVGQRTPFATSQEYEDGTGLVSVLLFDEAIVPVEFPASGAVVEIIIRYRGPASDAFPYYLEGALGTVLMNFYDGVYSLPPLDGIDGSVYDPAGLDAIPQSLLSQVRYDPSAFANMTEPVLLRQIEPVLDGRSWAETMLYSPSGWIPALDNDAIISPLLRNRPSTIDATLALTNANTSPTPGWGISSRTVSEISYMYPRYFVPLTDEEFVTAPDGLAIRPITITYRDSESELRHNRQPVDYDASAFASIGTPEGLPLSGTQEAVSMMAQAARFDILERYREGVQTFSINVRRDAIPTVRVGEWVPWILTWFPNRSTGTRGSISYAAQIIAIRDDNCMWRTLTLEESASVGSLGGVPGYVDTLVVLATDELDPGLIDSLVVFSDDDTDYTKITEDSEDKMTEDGYLKEFE